jgi:protein-tyrosine phosphatase
MSGFVDLHLHFVPGVDDGARDLEEALALCAELKAIGFDTLVTTPHIRSGMFDNRREGLVQAFEAFKSVADTRPHLPALQLSAEHHCDSTLLELLQTGGLLPYPGERAILIEFAYDQLPINIERVAYMLALKNLRPVVAHQSAMRRSFARPRRSTSCSIKRSACSST